MLLRAISRLALLSIALAFTVTHAQTPPPVAPLPDPSTLPEMPRVTRMPGADHRECGPTKWSALCAAGRWTLLSNIELRVGAPGFSARYELEQAENGEVHATYREQIGKDTRAGEIVLFGIDGVAYRSRDKFDDKSAIVDYALSTPIMMSQLAALLLDLGVLGPPADVNAPQAIAASSDTQYIRTSAPRKAVLYGAPWSMTGTVRRAGPEKVGFTLRLRFHPVDGNGNAIARKTDVVKLEGTASYAPRRATLPDSLDLTGWRLVRAGDGAELRRVSKLSEARQALTP